MAITYSWKIRLLNRTTVYGLPDIISHVHFDYVGTDENSKTVTCQGTLPFELKPITIEDKAANKTITIPAVFNKDSYIPYDQIDDAVVISWLEAAVPQSLINTFQNYISKQLTDQE